MLGWLVGGSIASSLLGGLISSSAASRAAKAQSEATNRATEESARQFDEQMAQYQKDQAYADQRYLSEQSLYDKYRNEALSLESKRYNTVMGNASPYLSTGESALSAQRALLGLGNKDTMLASAEANYKAAIDAANANLKTKQGLQSGVDTQSMLAAKTKAEQDLAATATGASSAQSKYDTLKAEATSLLSAAKKGDISASQKLKNINLDRAKRELDAANLAKSQAESVFNDANNAYTSAQSNQTASGELQSEYDKAVAAAKAERNAAIAAANSAPSGAEQQALAIQGIENSPEMAALTKQGETSLLQNAAATGGLRGGNTQGALAEFRPSLLSNLINQQYERLGQLSGLGQNTVLGTASTGSTIGGNVASYGGQSVGYPSGQNTINLLQQQGAIEAGNALAQGNAWQSLPNAFMTGLGTYAGLGGFNQGSSGSSVNTGGYMPWGNWGIQF